MQLSIKKGFKKQLFFNGNYISMKQFGLFNFQDYSLNWINTKILNKGIKNLLGLFNG